MIYATLKTEQICKLLKFQEEKRRWGRKHLRSNVWELPKSRMIFEYISSGSLQVTKPNQHKKSSTTHIIIKSKKLKKNREAFKKHEENKQANKTKTLKFTKEPSFGS